MRYTLRLFVLALVLMPITALAQVNSPPPALMGEPSYHLYTVPGVTSSNGIYAETFFRCTNTTTANIRVGVEVFDLGGNLANDASASSLDFFPGGSFGFATSSAVRINSNSVLGPGLVSVGSARILATKPKGVICTAFLGDPANFPPAFMGPQLNVIKKITQKGD